MQSKQYESYKLYVFLLPAIFLICIQCMSIDRGFETKNRIFIQSDKLNSINLEIKKNGLVYFDKTPAIVEVENSFNSSVSIKVLESDLDKKDYNLRNFDFGIVFNLALGIFGLPWIVLDIGKGYHWKYDSVYTIELNSKNVTAANQSCHEFIKTDFRPEYRRTVGVYALTIGSALFLGALTPSKCFHCSKSGENIANLFFGGVGLGMAFGGGSAIKDDFEKRKTYLEWEANTANKVLAMKESCSVHEQSKIKILPEIK